MPALTLSRHPKDEAISWTGISVFDGSLGVALDLPFIPHLVDVVKVPSNVIYRLQMATKKFEYTLIGSHEGG